MSGKPAGANGPMTRRIGVAVGLDSADRAVDPLRDLVPGSLRLRRATVEYLRPRSAMELIYEQNFDATEAYPPYWAELWASGVELAYAVSEEDLAGRSVLELGCGLGLPGIAAALGGARVLATDRSPDAVAITGRNARRSGATLDARTCAWSEPELITDRAPWDLVLAADVLYGQRHVDELLALLPRLVDGGGEVWLADPGRPLAAEFLAACQERWETLTATPTRDPEVTIHRIRGPRLAGAADASSAEPAVG